MNYEPDDHFDNRLAYDCYSDDGRCDGRKASARLCTRAVAFEPDMRANFKTSHFAQSLRLAPILILEIRGVFLRLNLAPSLTLDKLKRFETGR